MLPLTWLCRTAFRVQLNEPLSSLWFKQEHLILRIAAERSAYSLLPWNELPRNCNTACSSLKRNSRGHHGLPSMIYDTELVMHVRLFRVTLSAIVHHWNASAAQLLNVRARGTALLVVGNHSHVKTSAPCTAKTAMTTLRRLPLLRQEEQKHWEQQVAGHLPLLCIDDGGCYFITGNGEYTDVQ